MANKKPENRMYLNDHTPHPPLPPSLHLPFILFLMFLETYAKKIDYTIDCYDDFHNGNHSTVWEAYTVDDE